METPEPYNVVREHETERRPWRCTQCDEVLGWVERHNGVSRLHLYCLECRVVAIITAGVVVCQACGAEREWFAAQEGMERLIEKVTADG